MKIAIKSLQGGDLTATEVASDSKLERRLKLDGYAIVEVDEAEGKNLVEQSDLRAAFLESQLRLKELLRPVEWKKI